MPEVSSAITLATVVLFIPIVGLIILLFLNEETQHETIKWTALGTSLVAFAASILLWVGYNANVPGLQFVQKMDWIPSAGISFYIGVDGLSILLIILTTFIMPLAILSSFRAHVLHERGRE